MSKFMPPVKKAKTPESTIVRTESVSTLDSVSAHPRKLPEKRQSSAEESGIPTTVPPSSEMKKGTLSSQPLHEKGHKVKQIEETWKTMDAQEFLRLTDTTFLNDVWVIPLCVEQTTSPYISVMFLEILFAPHIKFRKAQSKMFVDDLLRMLYLNDRIQRFALDGAPIESFEKWVDAKTAKCIVHHGRLDGTNKSIICNFIINEDETFSMAPKSMNGTYMMFRKICYHSYKGKEGEPMVKYDNISMIKCKATRGKSFEFIIEGRYMFLNPDEASAMFSFETGTTSEEKCAASAVNDDPYGVLPH